MDITSDHIARMMQAVRVTSQTAYEDIEELLQAFPHEMDIAGACVTDLDDALTWQAAKLYCKSHYGYDEDTERFHKAFSALRDSMALSGDYPMLKAGDDDVQP